MGGITGLLGQGRIGCLADLLRDRAPGAEPAAGRDAQRARHVAGHGRPALRRGDLAGRAVGQPGNGGEQALRIGMPGGAEQPFGGGDLDDPAQVHDGDTVAQVPDHREVVRDEQQREAQLTAQVTQQVQDRRLDADVQGRYRLVGHEDVGPQGQGPGDRDPLALAARELPGVRAQRVRAEADQVQQFLAVRLDLARRHDVMDPEQFAQHAADGQPGVQRRVRILEDHLDPPLVGARPASGQHPAAEADLAMVHRAQPGQRQGQGRLA